MRDLTTNASNKLSQNMGTELMVLVEIEWTDGGSIYYSDQDITGARTKVVEMDGFDSSMMLEGSAASQELSIVLDDTDNHIRDIYNSRDIHKRPARVYLLHKGLPLSDKILVFKGELVTPIEWDETQRSVRLNILSKLNSKQVGFSMEEGDFPNIPDEALGKAWPLAFGQVCHLPAVKVRAPRRGYLQEGVGIHDFTLEPRLCQAIKIQCPSQSTGLQFFTERGADNTWNSTQEKTVGPDLECVNRRYGEICRLKDLLDQQKAYEEDTINIYNGVSFPQNTPVTIFIDNATFRGTFSGNTFSVTWRKHPEFDDFDHQSCRDVPAMGYGTVASVPQIGGSDDSDETGGYWQVQDYGGGSAAQGASATWVPEGNATYFSANQTDSQAFQSCDEALSSAPGLVGGPKTSWDYYDNMESSSFFWAPAGSEVYMESESEILYIVSLLPGTVDGVAAYRTAPNGFSYLTEVPASYYTVYETDYGGYDVVEIGMNKALPLYNDQWEDQIYVSFTSSVGPNPCDIIEWLVNKYTDLTIDSASFASVKSYLTNYPSNFYLTTRPDVYKLINDIAYQSRCAVYIRNDVIYIRYLSVEPTSERTLGESDILSGSFVEFLSETEDVYTTHNISWQPSGAAVRNDQSIDRKLILKYNVNKYGTVEEDWDYYTYNIYELVLKSGTFWLIRKANSWKKLKFQLPIKHIDLDVGDAVTISMDQFSENDVKVVIESMQVDPDSYTIDVVCWTPIRSGETEEYYWAWPSQQSQYQIWPLAGDNNGGGGYDFDVTPPIGHILLGGEKSEDALIISSGDRHPSDLDDTLPSVECELSDYLNFDEKSPEILAKEIAQSAARQATENQVSGGGNAGGDGGSKETVDECGTGAGCNYKVIVTWHKSEAQGQATSAPGPCGGPCSCQGGCPTCYGAQWNVCYTYGSAGIAKSAANYWRSSYGKEIGAYWDCNEVAVLGVRVQNGTHDPRTTNNGADCEDVGSAEAEDYEEGGLALAQTAEPTGTTGDEPEV
jgi:hypothetical protein